jgi:hypothetical protein
MFRAPPSAENTEKAELKLTCPSDACAAVRLNYNGPGCEFN